MQDNKIKTQLKFHESDVRDIFRSISNIFQYSDYNTMKEIPEFVVKKFNSLNLKKDFRNYREGGDYELWLPDKNYIILGNYKSLHYYLMLYLYLLYRIGKKRDSFLVENDCVNFSRFIDYIWSNDSDIRFQYDEIKLLFIYISSDCNKVINEKYIPDFVRSRVYPTIILIDDKNKIPTCINSNLFEIIDFRVLSNTNNTNGMNRHGNT